MQEDAMKTPVAYLLRGTLGVLFATCIFSVVRAEEGNDPKKIPPGVLKKYDANQDGTLDATEKAAMEADKAKHMAERLERLDTNKNGKIDESELAAEKAAKDEMMAKKKAAMEAKRLEKFDANKDGKLDESEQAAEAAAKKAHKKPEAAN